MSVSIQHTPGEVNLLCDEVKLALIANDFLESAGAKAQASIGNSVGINMPTGHWLQFDWNGITERFYFEGFNDDGNSCTRLTSSNSSTWTQVHLAEALQSNYNLSRDFDINIQYGNQLSLTAKVKEAKSLAITQRTGYSSGVYATVNNQGATPVYRQGYRVVVQTWVQTADGKTTMVGEDNLSPDATGYCEGLFGELLRTTVRTTAPASGFGSADVAACAFDVVKFWFRYGEAWSTDNRRLYKTSDFWGIWGGVSALAKAWFDGMSDWASFFRYEKLFLTNMPPLVPTTLEAPQFLKWLCLDANMAQVLVKVEYWATSGHDKQTLYTISTPVQYRPYLIDVSLQKIINSIFGGAGHDTWLRYQITVETTTGTVLAGAQSYQVDHRQTRHTRYFLFRNSLGGFDTLVARGRQSTSMEVTRYTTEYNAAGQREAWRNEGSTVIEQQVGWTRANYKRYLAELMLSTKVLMVVPGHRNVAVIVTGESFTLETDDEQRPTFGFSCMPVQRDQFYSKYY